MSSSQDSQDLGQLAMKLKVESFSSETNEPLDIMLVLDNSFSMKANIDKLKKSLPTLYEKLISSGADLSTRVVTLDMLLSQLEYHQASKTMAPTKLFEGDSPSYDRSASQTPYHSVQIAAKENVITSISNNLAQVASNSLAIQNEPGICLAMDYINWAAYAPSADRAAGFDEHQKLHVIVLSDEDNDRTFQNFDEAGNLLNQHDLACYQESSPEKCSLKKFDNLLSWDEHCYSYTKPKTEYHYKVSYQQRGLCQIQGYVNDSQTMDLVKLRAEKRCYEAQYKCNNKNSPKQYGCSAGSYSTLSTSDLTSQNSGRLRCSVYEQQECLVKIDGEPFWVEKTRSQAANLSSVGIECRDLGPASSKTLNLSEAFHSDQSFKPGVSSCLEFSCQVSSWNQVSIRARDTSKSQYEDCSLIKQLAYSSHAFNIAESDAALRSVSPAACSNFYELVDVSAYSLSNKPYCAANLAEITLPAGVSYLKSGESKTELLTKTLTGNLLKRTRAQVAAELGLAVEDIVSFEEIENDRTLSVQNECYSYPLSKSSDMDDFKKLSTKSFVDIRDKDAQLPAKKRSQDIRTRVSYNKDGLHQEKSCDPSSSSLEIFGANPHDFLRHMRSKFPKMSLTWHSIINMDGKSCPGLNEKNVFEGKDYKDLSAATGGVVDNICAENFDQSLAKIATSVLTELKVTYDLLPGLADHQLLTVKNASAKKILRRDVDFWISQNTIVFSKRAVGKDDQIEIYIGGSKTK